MSFTPITGTHCGHVKQYETVLRTGTYQDDAVLIFQVKNNNSGLYSIRYFPCSDPVAFVDKGMRYANNQRISAIKAALKRFDNVSVIAQDPLNQAHKVFPWTNMWAWEDSPMRQNDANGKYSMVLELNVPATGWQFNLTSPEVTSVAAVHTALFQKFRLHFQGCMINWKSRVDATPDVKPVPTNLEDQLFG